MASSASSLGYLVLIDMARCGEGFDEIGLRDANLAKMSDGVAALLFFRGDPPASVPCVAGKRPLDLPFGVVARSRAVGG